MSGDTPPETIRSEVEARHAEAVAEARCSEAVARHSEAVAILRDAPHRVRYIALSGAIEEFDFKKRQRWWDSEGRPDELLCKIEPGRFMLMHIPQSGPERGHIEVTPEDAAWWLKADLKPAPKELILPPTTGRIADWRDQKPCEPEPPSDRPPPTPPGPPPTPDPTKTAPEAGREQTVILTVCNVTVCDGRGEYPTKTTPEPPAARQSPNEPPAATAPGPAARPTHENEREPEAPTDPQPEKVPSPAVILAKPGDEPIVRGKKMPRLTQARANVIMAMLKAWPHGLSKDELAKKSGHSDAVNLAKEVSKLSREWKSVILLPGREGRGQGYRIASE